MTSSDGQLHGILIIDKPAGWTSHDVVARVRRLTGERKVGHAGTLDPAATGVLPVAVGDGTRVLEFLSEASKTYLAGVTIGVSTDSGDIDGVVTASVDPGAVTRAEVERVLHQFQGPQLQVPPMYSAVKIGGQRLYDLARKGLMVDRQARQVVLHELELLSWKAPVAEICIDCSKGSYVRTLAQDIGTALGLVAHLSNLVRIRSGPFWLEDAWTLADLEQLPLVDQWESIAVHPDEAMSQFGAIVLDNPAVIDWHHGRIIAGDVPGDDSAVRAYSVEGHFLGVARWSGDLGAWRPVKVLGGAA